MLARPVRSFALALVPWLACACDSDNVSWAFVSNPSGSSGHGGGIIIIINGGGSNRLSLEGDVLQVPGFDARGPVTAMLPHGGDVVVAARQDGLELRSPALPQGRVDLPGARATVCRGEAAALRLRLPASERVHAAAGGPGVLHVAARGTLLVLESATGLVVFGERPEPEVLPPKALLTASPDCARLAVLLGDGTLRELVPPPPPPLEQRLLPVPARNAVRILGPAGETLAELPAACVQLQHGLQGLFLTAELPHGLHGDPGPFALLMARDNRFLLRVDAR